MVVSLYKTSHYRAGGSDSLTPSLQGVLGLVVSAPREPPMDYAYLRKRSVSEAMQFYVLLFKEYFFHYILYYLVEPLHFYQIMGFGNINNTITALLPYQFT